MNMRTEPFIEDNTSWKFHITGFYTHSSYTLLIIKPKEEKEIKVRLSVIFQYVISSLVIQSERNQILENHLLYQFHDIK